MDYEAIGLFDIFTAPQFVGNTYRFCWSWDATGTLPLIGGAAESRAYDYSDQLLLPFVQEDNGLVSATTTTIDDNGNIILPTTAGEEDNGSILNSVITPAQGTYTVSGTAHVVRLPSWVGSGGLFAAGGLAETKTSTEFGEDTSLGDLSGIATCLLYTSPSPRDRTRSRMPSSA